LPKAQGRRSTDEEFIRFLQIALGSLCELETHLELSLRLNLISNERAAQLRPALDEVGRLLNGLIRSKRH
jgi:four helix bundle protein